MYSKGEAYSKKKQKVLLNKRGFCDPSPAKGDEKT